MCEQELLRLYQLHWLPSSAADTVPPGQQDWVYELQSMTARLEQYCRAITVEVVKEGYVGRDVLLPHEIALAADSQESRYWLREVILYGDGVPWLAGRTVLPESTLSGPELALVSLGECPLGRYLFSSPLLERDFILPGKSGDLWGRYSLLRLSGKPLMLTEIFLPLSPVYYPVVKG